MATPRLEEMETFARVVEAQSFTRAARRLGVAPSAVSRHVRSLETRLGVRLLNRTTRQTALTDAGRTFYEATREVLVGVEEAERAVRGRHGAPTGALRVSVPVDFARLQLAKPLAAFAARYPSVALDIDASDRFVDLIGEGFDVAVRIAALSDSSFVARRLGPCRFVVCATPTYLKRHGTPRTPRDLEAHPCIAYEYLGSGSWAFRTPRGRRTVRPTGRLRTNSGEIMRRLVLAGHGIAMLPTFLVGDDVRAKRLRVVLGDQLEAESSVYAVYPHRKLLAGKVRAFVDHLAKRCGEHPAWDRGIVRGTQ